ncbi:MAG: methyltransferase domain-containing protein [Candidatus Aenigmarchaeota archaeon]|nr:methyltransferase domain-containing protein [Candidatus Aenigmarchaeota archaeon]
MLKYVVKKNDTEKLYRATAKPVADMLPKKMKGRLLDIGCYKGYLRDYLPKTVVYTGLDLDKWFPEIVICDLNNQKLPFKTNYFDYVICANVLEHIFYPEKICEEIKRVLKPKNIAIISLPNDFGLSSKYSCLFEKPSDFDIERYRHHWRFSIKTAKDFISKYFKIKEIKMYNGHILNKFDFLLKHFPDLCSNIYMKTINL